MPSNSSVRIRILQHWYSNDRKKKKKRYLIISPLRRTKMLITQQDNIHLYFGEKLKLHFFVFFFFSTESFCLTLRSKVWVYVCVCYSLLPYIFYFFLSQYEKHAINTQHEFLEQITFVPFNANHGVNYLQMTHRLWQVYLSDFNEILIPSSKRKTTTNLRWIPDKPIDTKTSAKFCFNWTFTNLKR